MQSQDPVVVHEASTAVDVLEVVLSATFGATTDSNRLPKAVHLRAALPKSCGLSSGLVEERRGPRHITQSTRIDRGSVRQEVVPLKLLHLQ